MVTIQDLIEDQTAEETNTRVIELDKMKQVLSWKLVPYWLVLVVLENMVYAIRGGR